MDRLIMVKELQIREQNPEKKAEEKYQKEQPGIRG